ncbi:uncharacterized protein K02A2.6-like [Saccostrea echinata]|uniref:uncharacterized protein K02A2.6-like n=1 Tax=Saccostrea echinata TaxID=191078 RepID=UPI002A838DA5|nr:uncharacterized protein K02A2.6-like [Saccostrea echinata]
MAGYIGKIEAFDGTVDTWTAYTERLEQYFEVNGITGGKRVPALLSLIGGKTYALLRNLTTPDKPLLRDRFVCGLRDEQTQKKLLSMQGLTLDKAIQIAVAMEIASKDALELQGKNCESGVNKLKFQKSKSKLEKPKPSNCYRCNKSGHRAEECRFKDATCHKCKKKGHIKAACRAKDQSFKFPKKVHAVDDDSDLGLYTVHTGKRNEIMVDVSIDGKNVNMELDTGSAVSVIPEKVFTELFPRRKLEDTSVTLMTYSGEKLKPLGVVRVDVLYRDQREKLEMYVVSEGKAILFGREWLRKIKLDWNSLNNVTLDINELSQKLEKILDKHSAVFTMETGSVNGIKANLIMKESAKPVFVKARSLAYALKPKVEKELERLESESIITKVPTSEWATPIVPIVKRSGDIRICGDFKVTINPQLEIEQYPLPRIEDIFASLAGGQKFSKIDLKNAYLQLEVEEESKKFLTINTHRGLYRYNRLLFGVASAPAIWQRTIDTILQGLNGVQCILDDMVITGRNDAEHLENLRHVLQRLEEYNLRANKSKCQFFQDQIEYCGHLIDKQGLHKTKDKIKAVLDTPEPTNTTQLRAFLGLVNYYHKFLPNLSSVAHPLHKLLEKEVKWQWTKECQEAFEEAKRLVTSDQVLCHYDPNLPIRLACDASPFGLGAVLSHVLKDGTEHPIAFASRTLNKAEKNYSQIDKEALSIVFGVKKFHTYLYGREFTLITDHQPLVSIFNPKKGISVTSAARMQRHAIFLSGYTYNIEYRNTKRHTNADGLSRIPQEKNGLEAEDLTDVADMFTLSQMEQISCLTHQEIRRETSRDKILSKVYDCIVNGWTENEDPNLNPYFSRRNELTVSQGCVMWGCRVIIPQRFQKRVLEMFHSAHPGIVRMKLLMRSYVWWPKIDLEIEKLVKSCSGCQKQRHNPKTAPLHPWEWPSAPWKRIHIDFAGPFL